MKKNFASVYGFGALLKEAVCLDVPYLSMAGYFNEFAGVS
jgi:hypothetical protein